jgi:hypothetical protein
LPVLLAGENQAPIGDGSGRLALARWIASPDNPLTARVMMNRIWQHHFGEGIVRTPNNFGKLGTPPTHPELLDWLAGEFVKSGWSIKAMHRLICNSAAYQQASSSSDAARDPDNLLFGRQNRRRLEAESLRDAMLFTAGQLDLQEGGPSVRDLDGAAAHLLHHHHSRRSGDLPDALRCRRSDFDRGKAHRIHSRAASPVAAQSSLRAGAGERAGQAREGAGA